MDEIKRRMSSLIGGLSDENYEQSLASYRLWFDIGHTYLRVPSQQILDDIWNNKGSSAVVPVDGKLFHPTVYLILRFARDAETDPTLSPHTARLQSRFSEDILGRFLEGNMESVRDRDTADRECKRCGYRVDHRELASSGSNNRFAEDSNIIAWQANSGYVKETAIRNHILQSLIDPSHSKVYDHQADAMIILFKIAGATFEAFADPSVVDRCFAILKDHYSHDSVKGKLAQEVIELRERGWEGLPPPPVFAVKKSKPIGVNKVDPSATPVATSLGLPNTDLEPQIPRPPSPQLGAAAETGAVPESPATNSPSISIATLSDFTIADTSDEESLADPTTMTLHDTFYLKDGNVEVLCGNTLFRVHTSAMSFHSPTLRQAFAEDNLTAAESPNGCPRILSSDTATDFATLLKTVYLPAFPERDKAPDFDTFSSLLRITAKYEMPTVRSQLLEVVHDAYPATFDGVTLAKSLGESVFSGPAPHPNKVLSFFIQQGLTSTLPMAYYMAVRKGSNSLMDTHLPKSATLSPETLRAAIGGLMALREVELNEAHRLVFGPKDPHPFSGPNCLSRTPTSPAALETYQKVFDHVVGPSQLGTRVLQVPELYRGSGGNGAYIFPGVCRGCVEGLESGHAKLRKKAWEKLPEVFGLS